jgi:hypothetical protein
MRDALHARLVASETLSGAIADEPGEPVPLRRIEPRPQHQRCMRQKQPAQYFQRHARRRPWPGKARANAAGIAEAGFETRARLAVDDRHLMAVAGEIVGTGDSDDACAQHQDLHAPSLIPF